MINKFKNKQTNDSENGTALLAVLVMAFIIAAVATTTAMMFQTSLERNKFSAKRTEALSVADGAAYQALAMVAENPDHVSSPPSDLTSGQIGDGTYDVSLEKLSDGTLLITSQATVEDHSETIRVFFRRPTSDKAFEKSVFSNGDFVGSGGGSVNSNIEHGTHSNQDTELKGHVSIGGNAAAVGSVSVKGGASVGGTTKDSADRIPFPELDFVHYQNEADTVLGTGGKTKMTGGTYNGLIWVVGDVKISSHTTINGSLFATGDIDVSGDCDIYQDSDRPAYASKNGNIKLSGNGDVEGVVYAQSGRIDVSGSQRIAGALIAWGEVSVRGDWGMVDYTSQNPKLKGGNTVKVVAWEY
mgnify:CR=1 FL=1